MTLCFASNNQHKLEEIRALVGHSINLISLADAGCQDELPETHDTLSGNSLEKAEYVFRHFSIPCFADDTGLEVDVLHGAPGVYSARYAGLQKNSEDNIQLLLKNLEGQLNRKAQFRTTIALVGLEKEPVFFEGVVRGEIISQKKGTQGFGYDPVFVPEGHARTFGEMDMEEKNHLSHRALAVKKLSDYLRRYIQR